RHSAAETVVSFPDKAAPAQPNAAQPDTVLASSTDTASETERSPSQSAPDQDYVSQRNALLQEQARIKASFNPAFGGPERQAAEQRLDEIKIAYQQLALEQAGNFQANDVNQLGLDDYLAQVNGLAPELSQALQRSGGGEVDLSGVNLQNGLNFPVAMMLSQPNPVQLHALNRVFEKLQDQPGVALSAAEMNLLKQNGLYLHEGQLVNLLTQQAVNPQQLQQLSRLSKAAADGNSRLSMVGNASFQALGQVSSAMATALGDLEALKQARQRLDGLVADLAQAEAETEAATDKVDELVADSTQVEAELAEAEADDAVLAKVETEGVEALNPTQRARWQGVLAQEEVQPDSSGGYRWQGRTITQPRELAGGLRARRQSRIEGLRQRLGDLGGRLRAAREELAQLRQRTSELREQVVAQQTEVRQRVDQSNQSMGQLLSLRNDPAVWNLLPPELRSELEARIGQLQQAQASEVQAAQASDARATAQVASADRVLAEADRALGQANAQLRDLDSLLSKERLTPLTATTASQQHVDALNHELEQVLNQSHQDPQTQNWLEELRDLLNTEQHSRRDTQNSEQQSRLNDTRHSQRLRAELAHHSAKLESFDQSRREQLEQLLNAASALLA
ncbi:MAG: hypothetical protein CVV27_09075, partial [Candidatus Melainabacteria bacterium HGW-Melainabacteria-1]